MVFLFATGTAKTVAGVVLSVSGGIIALPFVVLAVEDFFQVSPILYLKEHAKVA